jgi:hypothetical protein
MSQRARGKYDVLFDDGFELLGFNLANEGGRPAVVSFESSPARTDMTVQNADVARIVDNLDGGMGYSRRLEQVPNGYAYTLPGYCRSPGGIFMPPGKVTEISMPPTTGGAGSWVQAPLWGSVRFVNQIWVFSTTGFVLRLTADGTAMEVVGTLVGNIRGAAVFNNRLYVASTAGLIYYDPVTSWSAPSPTVVRRSLVGTNWRPLGVPTDVLVGLSSEYGGNAVRWCPITADPMVDANWSAPVRIGGDLQYGTHAIVGAPRHVFFTRPDGVYDMDELGTRAFNIAPWISSSVDYYNGLWGMSVGEGLYYGHSQGLAFIPTTGEAQYRPEWATPGWGLPYEGPIRGIPTTGCLYQGWGFLAQWVPGTAQTYISAGRRDPAGAGGGMAYGQASHVWHGAEAVMADHVDHMTPYTLEWGSGQPRLLMTTSFGTDPYTVKAFWQSLPKWGNPLQELIWGGGFDPGDTAALYLPADPWDRPSAIKTLLELEMVTERLSLGSDTLQGYAMSDPPSAWTDYGTAEEGAWSSLAPLETVEGRYLSVRVDAVGSPVLRSVALRAAVGVQLREARTYRLVLAWDNALKGARSRETADPERRLFALRGMLGRIIRLDDGEHGGPFRVRVLQVLAGERVRLGGPARASANGTEGAWAIVVPVTVSFLDKPFRWDGRPATDRFDIDRTWA